MTWRLFVAALLLTLPNPLAAETCQPQTYDALTCRTSYDADACKYALAETLSQDCRIELEKRFWIAKDYAPTFATHNTFRWYAFLAMLALIPLIAIVALLIARRQNSTPPGTFDRWLRGLPIVQAGAPLTPSPIGRVPFAAASLLFGAAMTCIAMGFFVALAIVTATLLSFIAILILIKWLAPPQTQMRDFTNPHS